MIYRSCLLCGGCHARGELGCGWALMVALGGLLGLAGIGVMVAIIARIL